MQTERKINKILNRKDNQPPKPGKTEEAGTITYKWIQKTYLDHFENGKKLSTEEKKAIYNYLRHKAYLQKNGKTFDGSGKQYRDILKMAKQLQVFR